MTPIAKFQIEDVFELTRKGIVCAGRITEGAFSIGDIAVFELHGSFLKREIIGIEGIRHSQPQKINVGLVFKCHNDDEIKQVKETPVLIDIYPNTK